jgi:hypothetical protein
MPRKSRQAIVDEMAKRGTEKLLAELIFEQQATNLKLDEQNSLLHSIWRESLPGRHDRLAEGLYVAKMASLSWDSLKDKETVYSNDVNKAALNRANP